MTGLISTSAASGDHLTIPGPVKAQAKSDDYPVSSNDYVPYPWVRGGKLDNLIRW
jgi:hypothetical protein